MPAPTYPDKRIHTRSFQHVETGRLLARLEWIRANWPTMCRRCEQKGNFRDHVREIVNLERELTHRGVEFTPITDSAHLATIPVSVMRTILPPVGRREREAANA